MEQMAMGIPLDSIAHIIQVAITPVFLLSGIASLLNVFTARVGRVADQADAALLALRVGAGDDRTRLLARLGHLRRRLRVLDFARACGALAGAAICGATFALFLGALQDTGVATLLFITFGISVLGTMLALFAFFAEIVLAWERDRRLTLPSWEQ